MFDEKKRDKKLKGRFCIKIWDYANKYDCKMFYNSFGVCMYLSIYKLYIYIYKYVYVYYIM